MAAVLAAELPSAMALVVSLADEPAVEDSQLVWPLKLKLWFSAITACANSVSSEITAWRTATRPVMMPRTRIVATNTHSVAIRAPQSSFHSLRIFISPQSVETDKVGHHGGRAGAA